MEVFEEKIHEYLDYFESIRRKIFTLAIIFIIFFILGFLNSGLFLKYIIKYFDLENASIITTSPFQFVDLSMSIGMYTGFIVCLPIFVFFLYRFIEEGLNKSEKKFFFVVLPTAILLFIVGFTYGAVVLDYALNSIAGINVDLGIKNLWDISTFLYQIIFTSLLLGILFQFPIVLSLLVSLGLIDAGFLKKKRRHAYVIIFIATSFLPPTDGLSLIIMALPLVLIYEITILVNFRSMRPAKVIIVDNNT